MTVRKPVSIFFVLFLVCTLSLGCAETNLGNPADGDEDGADGQFDIVTFSQGGTHEGGNGREVFLTFSPHQTDSPVNWDRFDLHINRVFLSSGDNCNSAQGIELIPENGSINVETLDIGRRTKLRLIVPSEETYCSIGFGLSRQQTAIRAEGVTSEDQRLIINSNLDLLSFSLDSKTFEFVLDNEYEWIAVIDLSSVLPEEWREYSGFVEGEVRARTGKNSYLIESGTIYIDSYNNPALMDEVNWLILESFNLYQDLDRDGEIDAEELNDPEAFVGEAETEADAEELICFDTPFEPVCGIDGITYENICWAEYEFMEVSHIGECGFPDDIFCEWEECGSPLDDYMILCPDGASPAIVECMRLFDGSCAWVVQPCLDENGEDVPN